MPPGYLRNLVVTLSFAGWLIIPPLANANATLIVSQSMDETDPIAKGIASWCEKAKTASRGNIRCAPSGGHTRLERLTEELQAGEVDLVCFPHQIDPNRYRVSRVADLPFLGDFAETTSIAYQRVYEKTPLMAKEHGGYKVLAVFTQPPRFLFIEQSRSARSSNIDTSHPSQTKNVSKAVFDAFSQKWGDVKIQKARQMDGAPDQPVPGTVREVQPLLASGRIRTGLIFKGGISNVSYVFALSEAHWKQLTKEEQNTLNSISAVETAGLFGRAFDALELKANLNAQASGLSFYLPEKNMRNVVTEAGSAVEKTWLAHAQSAGLARPSTLLATFRGEISKLENSE